MSYASLSRLTSRPSYPSSTSNDEVGRYWWAGQYGASLDSNEPAFFAGMTGFGGSELFTEDAKLQVALDALWDVDW